jgi:hypothetical protein
MICTFLMLWLSLWSRYFEVSHRSASWTLNVITHSRWNHPPRSRLQLRQSKICSIPPPPPLHPLRTHRNPPSTCRHEASKPSSGQGRSNTAHTAPATLLASCVPHQNIPGTTPGADRGTGGLRHGCQRTCHASGSARTGCEECKQLVEGGASGANLYEQTE